MYVHTQTQINTNTDALYLNICSELTGKGSPNFTLFLDAASLIFSSHAS